MQSMPEREQFFRQPERPFYREHDPEANLVINVPRSDIYYWGLPRESFHIQTEYAFHVFRKLSGIRQLGILRYVPTDPTVTEYIELNHDRHYHSAQVALIAEQIAHNNNLDEHTKKELQVACWVHDLASNAGGDAIKYLDPEALDEETQLAEVIPERGWNFMRTHGISYENVYAMVNNQGVPGKILDIADKDSYTCQDLQAVSQNPLRLLNENRAVLLALVNMFPHIRDHNDIQEMIRQYPDIGNLYKDMRVAEDQTLYSDNQRRLLAFFATRAIMHTQLYLNPVNQGRDALMRRLAGPHYARDGSKLFSPRTLRQMDDGTFYNLLAQAYGLSEHSGSQLYRDLSQLRVGYERFNSIEEADEHARKLAEDDNTIILGVQQVRGFNPGTTFPVLDREDGRIKPLKEAEPIACMQVEAIEQASHGVDVYYMDKNRVAW